MVDGEKTIHSQERRVGERRVMFSGRAALGFELIAEIADVAADEIKRQGRCVYLNVPQSAIEGIEERRGRSTSLAAPM